MARTSTIIGVMEVVTALGIRSAWNRRDSVHGAPAAPASATETVADTALMNQHLEQAARSVAPEFAGFLTRHISDTVKSWDARDMSQQIELNIGKDLQFIRINGTLVGGTIGLILYLLSQLPAALPALSGWINSVA